MQTSSSRRRRVNVRLSFQPTSNGFIIIILFRRRRDKQSHSLSFSSYTHDQQRHSMLHKCRAAAEKACQQNDDRHGNQYVDSDVIWINVEDFNPLFEARLHSDPKREGEQAKTDEL